MTPAPMTWTDSDDMSHDLQEALQRATWTGAMRLRAAIDESMPSVMTPDTMRALLALDAALDAAIKNGGDPADDDALVHAIRTHACWTSAHGEPFVPFNYDTADLSRPDRLALERFIRSIPAHAHDDPAGHVERLAVARARRSYR